MPNVTFTTCQQALELMEHLSKEQGQSRSRIIHESVRQYLISKGQPDIGEPVDGRGRRGKDIPKSVQA